MALFLRVLCGLLLLAGSSRPAWAETDNYVVGEGDELKISVYQHDNMQTTVQVSGDNTVLLPLLGAVKVKGLTVPQVSDKIARLLSDGYIINPKVNVFVTAYRSKKAVILGYVYKPGMYEMSGPITLLELISKAGGLLDNAGDSAVIKNRRADGSETSRSIDLRVLMGSGNLSENMMIQDGDNVYISKAGFCYVMGEVQKPGAYKLDNKTTVIMAITLAGGYTGKASQRSVKVMRAVDGEKQPLPNATIDTLLQDDDVIIVPESFF